MVKGENVLPPALRMTWASPRVMPKAEAGSIRASIQVTVFVRWNLWYIVGIRRNVLTDGILLGGWEGERALGEGGGVGFVGGDEVLLDGCWRHVGLYGMKTRST